MSLTLKANRDETSIEYIVQVLSVGFDLLSPVLYLTANVSIKSYRNIDDDCSMTGAKIVMRVSNSFQSSIISMKILKQYCCQKIYQYLNFILLMRIYMRYIC